MNEVTFDKTWADTIHRSKYFMARCNGQSVQFRYSNHSGGGNDFETVIKSDDVISIGNDLYYEIGNFHVYSRKLKNQKTVVAALTNSETVINDINQYTE
jgi:hypothetical protein